MSNTFRAALAAIGGLLVAACGSGGAAEAVDAAPSIDAYTGLCPIPPGAQFVFRTMEISAYEEGRDLTGDDVIDNELGNLPSFVRDELARSIDLGISRGEIMIGLLFEGWELPAPPPAALTAHIFILLDADSPQDPSDNIGGHGRFEIDASRSFDLSCNSLNRFSLAVSDDGVAVSPETSLTFPLGVGEGVLDYQRAVFTLALDATAQPMPGKFTAMVPICAASKVIFPGLDGTLLQNLAANPLLAPYVSIDIDLDDDGLEQILADEDGISGCVDGDSTAYDQADCPCLPMIVDGYSMAQSFDLVSATFVTVR